MQITIISPSEVRVDGINYGAVADTIKNNPLLTSDIQIALVKFFQAREATFATLQAQFNALAAAGQQVKSALMSGDAKAIQAIIVEYEKPIKDKRMEEIDAQIATLQKEKQELV